MKMYFINPKEKPEEVPLSVRSEKLSLFLDQLTEDGGIFLKFSRLIEEEIRPAVKAFFAIPGIGVVRANQNMEGADMSVRIARRHRDRYLRAFADRE